MRGPGPGGPGAPGGPGGPGGERKSEPPTPGIRISPAEVKPESTTLYAPDTLRTLFLDFENADWEAELEAFHDTDVEVPATLTVDGRSYPGVGIHFRGMSSYMMVSAGHKRSLNVSLDFTKKKQRLDGYKTLNLLNSSGDGSFLSAVLYSHIARQYIPAPKVNLMRVVINGENWGVYVSQQQFNKDFIQENYRTGKGARWKVRGSPMGRGGLEYSGDDVTEYKKHFEMKDGDDEDWKALIKLCRTLNETPSDKLAEAVAPMLDIEGTLWFLALDCALINSDGYWIRASDYSLYRDKEGRFHLIPGDMNEAFRSPGGPGFGPRGGGGAPGVPGGPPAAERPRVDGVKLDPLVGLDDAQKPLRSKLLAVPDLRESYLAKVRTIAKDSLDWEKLGPVVARYRELVGEEITADTRKLSTTEEFENLTSEAPAAPKAEEGRRGPPGHGAMALKTFANERREFLLATPAADAKENP
ncbi:MAG: spore coat protein CotH [Verrucomicrobiaceae bacterium]|nr:MAG: spore coat protein CotH [Verrucomicrobiaceae bacterium]